MRKLWPVLIAVAAMGAACSRPTSADPQLAQRVNQLETENAQLRAKLAEAAGLPAPVSPGPAAGNQRAPAMREAKTDSAAYEALQNEVHVLRARAAESREMASGLAARRDELQGQLDAAAAENKRSLAAEAEAKERLADVARRMEKLQADLKTQQDAAAQLEAANGRLRQASAAAPQASVLISEWQDLSRRRQQYIDHILRRYSELTEHYRTLAGRFDGRTPGDAAIANGAEASRIQSTLAAVEEDVRQLNSLSARMQLVQKRMGAQPPGPKIP